MKKTTREKNSQMDPVCNSVVSELRSKADAAFDHIVKDLGDFDPSGWLTETKDALVPELKRIIDVFTCHVGNYAIVRVGNKTTTKYDQIKAKLDDTLMKAEAKLTELTAPPPSDDDSGLSPGVTAVIVILVLVVVLGAVGFVVYKARPPVSPSHIQTKDLPGDYSGLGDRENYSGLLDRLP
jgi:hypothetical protein